MSDTQVDVQDNGNKVTITEPKVTFEGSVNDLKKQLADAIADLDYSVKQKEIQVTHYGMEIAAKQQEVDRLNSLIAQVNDQIQNPN